MKSIDFIVRDCGPVGFLPIIEGEENGKSTTLYRGEHHRSYDAASQKLVEVWEKAATGNIREWKGES